MSNELLGRLKSVFAVVLPAEQLESFGPDSTMDNTEGWDSLNFLEVIMGIESQFDVRVDGLDAANMISVANILAYLEAQTQVDDYA